MDSVMDCYGPFVNIFMWIYLIHTPWSKTVTETQLSFEIHTFTDFTIVFQPEMFMLSAYKNAHFSENNI